jgi:predicted nucleic acid-binding protein
LTLDDVPAEAGIFVDSTIFLYHFTGASQECRRFLRRCESGEVDGLTSSVVLAEVAHRLMTIEAVASGMVSAGNVVKKLRSKPELVRRLTRYQQQVDKIPLMSVRVHAVDTGTLLRSAEFRSRYGLLVNDSLVLTSAVDHGVTALASADRDFERVEEVQLYSPGDLV